ncbi:MAG: metallophosphoesterase family protein [Armatimonadota bacterium]|nr:metallophosphoesterase family protein [Armatimonadota bacterium]
MRVAVFSDVHGNAVALSAVLEAIARLGPDHVVCGGDLALGGPDPEAATGRVRALGIPCVRGNTDEWLGSGAAASGDPLVAWTQAALDDASRRYLAGLPFEYRLDDLVVVHATPWSISDVLPRHADAALLARMLREARAAAVAYGHIHMPWVGRTADGGLVVNAGSVGFPFDGDARASFALLERGPAGWIAEVRRVAYDVEQAARRFPPDHPQPAPWVARMRTGRRG